MEEGWGNRLGALVPRQGAAPPSNRPGQSEAEDGRQDPIGISKSGEPENRESRSPYSLKGGGLEHEEAPLGRAGLLAGWPQSRLRRDQMRFWPNS